MKNTSEDFGTWTSTYTPYSYKANETNCTRALFINIFFYKRCVISFVLLFLMIIYDNYITFKLSLQKKNNRVK